MITKEEILDMVDTCPHLDLLDNCPCAESIRALLSAPTFKIDCPDCFGDDYTPCSRCVDGQITVVEVKEVKS
jgi:hypothetical protein